MHGASEREASVSYQIHAPPRSRAFACLSQRLRRRARAEHAFDSVLSNFINYRLGLALVINHKSAVEDSEELLMGCTFKVGGETVIATEPTCSFSLSNKLACPVGTTAGTTKPVQPVPRVAVVDDGVCE